MNVMASPLDTQSTGAHARLVAMSGPISGEVRPLTAGGARIGRDYSNDICLPDLALSRTHCPIGTPDGTWCTCDFQSSNGTFVNGVQVTDRQLNDREPNNARGIGFPVRPERAPPDDSPAARTSDRARRTATRRRRNLSPSSSGVAGDRACGA